MKYFTTVWKFRNLQAFVWKSIQAWMSGKSCFSHTIPIFCGRCNRYFNFETCGWKFTGYPILICSFSSSNKFFQKQTVFSLFFLFSFTTPVFTFTESWSRDQLIQKACSDPQLLTDSINQIITLDTRGFFSRVAGCFVVGRTKTKESKPITTKKNY